MRRPTTRLTWPLAVAWLSVTWLGHAPAAAAPAGTPRLPQSAPYDAAEVEARERLAAVRAWRQADPAETRRASEALVHALVANGRASAPETLSLARENRRARERRGDDPAATVRAIAQHAAVLAGAGAYADAIVAARDAIALVRGRAPQDEGLLAVAQQRLGVALSGAARHREAVRALEDSVRLWGRIGSSQPWSRAAALEDLVLALHRLGDYARAAAPLAQATGLYEDAAATGSAAFVQTLNLSSQQAWFEGRLIAARDLAQRAVALGEQTLRPDHPWCASSLRYLAGTLAELGDFQTSVELKRRAMAIAERSFGRHHHLTAEYLHTLGVAEFDLANYITARALLTRALGQYERRYGPAHQDLAAALSVLSETDASLGDYPRARQAQARALAIQIRVGGPTHPYVARSLVQLALIVRRQGAVGEAARLLRRALAMQERQLGARHRDVAMTMAELASVLNELGNADAGLALAVRAVGIWESLGITDAPQYASMLTIAGAIELDRAAPARAQAFYERAVRIRDQALGASHPLAADARIGLAHALAQLRRDDDAVAMAAGAESAAREHLRLMLQSLAERRALEYARSRPRGLDLLVSLASGSGKGVADAVDAVVRNRAMVLDELAARHAEARDSDGADPLHAALRASQQRLANLLVRGPAQLSAPVYVSVLADARAESERREEALATRGLSSRQGRRVARAGWADVARALPPETVLVSFVRFSRAVPGKDRGLAYVAFIVSGTSPPVAVPLGDAHEIESMVTRWRAAIEAEALQATDSVAPLASRRAGALVRARVWDALAPRLSGARHVFIVPDGILSLVPFAALPAGTHGYLVEDGPTLHYLTAERDVLAALDRREPTGRGLLAVGGAAFDVAAGPARRPAETLASAVPAARPGTRPCADLSSVQFSTLAGTSLEVAEVSRLWPQAPPRASGPTVTLLGREASESRVKRDAHQFRVLHLATHGFFLDGRCAPGVPNLRGIGGVSRTAPARVASNPLRLSGLAFAGANRRSEAALDGDDGILTAEEVSALHLSDVEWAVLSACDSGLGEVSAGEGVFGLRRAFHVAGVRTVIMSLWAVEDRATRVWMRELYRGRFVHGRSTAAAVRSATLETLRSRRAGGRSTSPVFWAGFVAAGDWR